MKGAMLILTLFVLTGCNKTYDNSEYDGISTYDGNIVYIIEYKMVPSCDLRLDNGFLAPNVNIKDCKKLNLGDKVLVVEKHINGKFETWVEKIRN